MSEIKVFLNTNSNEGNPDSSDIIPQPSDEPEISVPDTGQYIHDNPSNISPSLAFFIIVIPLLIIVLYKHFHHNHRIFSASKKFSLSSRRNKILSILILPLSILSIFYITNNNQKTEITNASPNDSLSIITSDINLTINREQDQPAFNYTQNDITIIDGTSNGYTLGMYATSTEIKSPENSTDKIIMTQLSNTALEENTWGVSTVVPNDQDSEVWGPIPTSQENAIIIKDSDASTSEKDTTSIYYGANIGPDLPDGAYSGVTINYFALANVITPDTYTLSFNSNNGTDAPSKKTCSTENSASSCLVTIPNTEPTRAGYIFKGWADSASATTAEYQPGNSITISGNKTIYAVWEIITNDITLSFNANNGTNAPNTQNCTIKGTATSCKIVITSNEPTRNGYNFLGWADSASATTAKYQPNDNITLSSDKTLYAVWGIKTNTHRLSFNANGGIDAPSAQTCNVQGTATSCAIKIDSNIPTRAGYNFKGWADSASATAATYQPNNSITISGNKTIYAIWEIKTTTYSLFFNANGGINAPNAQTCTIKGTATSCTIIIGSTKPTYSSYTFLGWADSTSATAAKYQPGNSITISGNKTIYAIWRSQGKIYFINTGTSNAFLLESNGHYGLIDASSPLYPKNDSDVTTCMSESTCVSNPKYTVSQVVTFLNKLGVKQLDFVIGSHSHSDHIGGMPLIAQRFVNSNTTYYYRQYTETVEDTTVPDWYNSTFYNRAINAMRNAGATLKEVTDDKNVLFNLSDCTIRLYNTEKASGNELNNNGIPKKENDNSIVILAQIGDKKTLFASDMEIIDETKVAEEVGTIDILQMGHHGGTTSTSDSFINSIKPHDIIVPSVPFTVTSHSRQLSAIIKAHNNNGAKTYVTGPAENAIVVSFQNNNYIISDYDNALNNSRLIINPVADSNGKWYSITANQEILWAHANLNGKLDTGWKKLSYNNQESWFYFFNNGQMATEWQLIDYNGKEQWFYLGKNGRMVTGAQTIDGENFTFNTSGVCIQGRGCPNNPL